MTTRARVADQAGPRTKTTATTPAKKTAAKKTTRKAAVKKAFQQPSTRDFVKKMTVEIDQDAHAELKMIAARRVADELGVSKEALRVWVRKHKDTGLNTPAQSVDLEVENRRLRAELAEAKRANDILKKASAFCRKRSSTAHTTNRQVH